MLKPSSTREIAEAKAQLVRLGNACFCGTDSPEYVCLPHQDIAAAIESALNTERERCAKIAENWWATKSSFGSPEVEAHNTASVQIAELIRKGE